MESRLKSVGRPKKNTDKKNFKIDVRFTEAEYKIINELAGTLGLSLTDLVRSKVLNNSNNIIVNAKEAIRSLDTISAELHRGGNNINQLARYANSLSLKSVKSETVIERFNMLFSNYIAIEKDIESALRSITRKMIK